MAGFRYGDMLLMSKGEISSVFYFNETSVKNHRSFFFYSNIFDFRNMTLFDNIQRYLATTASKPCFTLYVIQLVVQGLFSMFLFLINIHIQYKS